MIRLSKSLRLSDRYISDRYLPDKAIDVIDETGSRIKTEEIYAPRELKELETDIQRFAKEKKPVYQTA